MIRTAATEFLAGFDAALRPVAEHLVAGATKRVFPKGHRVLSPGETADRFYYQHTGVTRNFLRRGRHEVTTWLTLDAGIVTALASLARQRPSAEAIEVVERAHVLEFDAAALRRSYREVAGAERLGRLVTEHYFALLTQRLHDNTVMSARDRYAALLADDPAVIMRVPLGIVAGYLGMTQETLSRVRRRLAEGRA